MLKTRLPGPLLLFFFCDVPVFLFLFLFLFLSIQYLTPAYHFSVSTRRPMPSRYPHLCSPSFHFSLSCILSHLSHPTHLLLPILSARYLIAPQIPSLTSNPPNSPSNHLATSSTLLLNTATSLPPLPPPSPHSRHRSPHYSARPPAADCPAPDTAAPVPTPFPVSGARPARRAAIPSPRCRRSGGRI